MLAMLVDKLPLPSKLPVKLVCHCLNGKARLVLCNKIHAPPGVPFVAEIENAATFKPTPVMYGDEGCGAKIAPTKALAVGFKFPGRAQEYAKVSKPPLSPEM